MAVKKNKSRTKSTTKKTVAKKVTTKKTVLNKTKVKKKPAPVTATKASSRKSKTAAKVTVAKTRSKPTSVDGILKSFQKERVTQEAKLVSVRNQIKDLTDKIQTAQKKIAQLKSEQLDTENSICTLDIRRDQEVAELLTSLGINLDNIATAGDMAGKRKVDKPTPLFDSTQPAGDKETDADDPAAAKPTVPVVLIAGKK